MAMVAPNASAPRDAWLSAYGPCAVVTGASDGIGRALALELAAKGFELLLVARRAVALAEVAAECERLYGTRATTLAADLATPAGVVAALEASERLDVGLFVAAAGFGTSGPFVDSELDVELNMIDLNCRSLAHMAHAFGRRFAVRRRGGIVLMSSLVAFQGVPRAANYAATKAYVQSLAEGLAAELRPLGVAVLASAPGPVKSGFGARAGMAITQGQTPAEVAAGTLKALGRRTTVRPGRLAKLLEWSLSPLPRWARVYAMGRVMAGLAVART